MRYDLYERCMRGGTLQIKISFENIQSKTKFCSLAALISALGLQVIVAREGVCIVFISLDCVNSCVTRMSTYARHFTLPLYFYRAVLSFGKLMLDRFLLSQNFKQMTLSCHGPRRQSAQQICLVWSSLYANYIHF